MFICCGVVVVVGALLLLGPSSAFAADGDPGAVGDADVDESDAWLLALGLLGLALVITLPVSFPVLVMFVLLFVWAWNRGAPSGPSKHVDDPPWPPVR
ncbi:Hypothetical protein BJL86_0985 [Dietzia timorensis]|uniref:Secreted protein n=1 Tax=Dietzia timorensis TaxID=499555 RepID=A0A173LJS9_9ACTN|nr:Hypothetical protein BJL86_0985 [Dietzia timorensis]